MSDQTPPKKASNPFIEVMADALDSFVGEILVSSEKVKQQTELAQYPNVIIFPSSKRKK